MPKLTPAERFRIWVDSALKIWPVIAVLLGATAYGNVPAVKQFINPSPPPTTEDVQPVEDGRYEQSIIDIIAKLKKHDTALKNINAGSKKSDNELIERIEVIEKLVN